MVVRFSNARGDDLGRLNTGTYRFLLLQHIERLEHSSISSTCYTCQHFELILNIHGVLSPSKCCWNSVYGALSLVHFVDALDGVTDSEFETWSCSSNALMPLLFRLALVSRFASRADIIQILQLKKSKPLYLRVKKGIPPKVLPVSWKAEWK